MGKIKSVKTKLLYTAGFEIIPIGTEGWKESDLWHFTSNFSTVHYSEEWILAHKDIFTIMNLIEGIQNRSLWITTHTCRSHIVYS